MNLQLIFFVYCFGDFWIFNDLMQWKVNGSTENRSNYELHIDFHNINTLKIQENHFVH